MIRPWPPPTNLATDFELHQCIEAFYNGVWWKGVVTKVPGRDGNLLYSVCFLAIREEFQFNALEIWRQIKWAKGECINVEHGDQSIKRTITINRNELSLYKNQLTNTKLLSSLFILILILGPLRHNHNQLPANTLRRRQSRRSPTRQPKAPPVHLHLLLLLPAAVPALIPNHHLQNPRVDFNRVGPPRSSMTAAVNLNAVGALVNLHVGVGGERELEDLAEDVREAPEGGGGRLKK
ncbi:uncharacterized protein A4U43_C08F12490 [Asparagus officinalis]|nr:uncharacterized protein A4U43_C08F12490 [Asparagus officinalis]